LVRERVLGLEGVWLEGAMKIVCVNIYASNEM